METTLELPRTEKKLRTYEEYLAWVGEDIRAEWVNGEVVVFKPPKYPHQLVVGFLHHVIGFFVKAFDLGRLVVAPFELKIHPDGSSREPDLMFLAKAHLDRLSDERIVGPPDLIIEVVSADSVHRDRVEILDEYEAGGVPEYWIIDNHTKRPRAWFYQLGADGTYQLVAVGADGIYRSKVLPGFWLRMEWLWAAEPDPLRALAEIVGPEQMAQAFRQSLAGAPSITENTQTPS
jgi:Uma2 family endonuclease